jgi:RNA polymerase sigma-70 factor (sigma-E family)
MAERDAAFVEYYRSRAEVMRSTAYLLAGDWHRAEDLVQSAFVKLYQAWHRVERHEALDAYVRQIVVRGYLDQRRRGWWRREQVAADPPEPDRLVDPPGGLEDRLDLLHALAQLPRRQRAVLVLRYWLDLPVTEVAALLDCAEGTVKSQAARGLAALRALVPDLPTTSTAERTS